jgi:hypothetical protein
MQLVLTDLELYDGLVVELPSVLLQETFYYLKLVYGPVKVVVKLPFLGPLLIGFLRLLLFAVFKGHLPDASEEDSVIVGYFRDAYWQVASFIARLKSPIDLRDLF